MRTKKSNQRSPAKKMRFPALLFSLLLAGVLVLGVTFSWFTSSDSHTNPLKSTQYDFTVVVVDTFTPEPSTPVDTPTPKQVGAKNIGNAPAFVRVLALPVIVAADGTILAAGFGGVITADMNDTVWTEGGDGYYYYLDVLEAGKETPLLFSEVTLPQGLPEAYDGARLKIEVKCEAADTAQWNYRQGWWGSESAPQSAGLQKVDNVLSAKARQ